MCIAAAALPFISLGVTAAGTGLGIVQSQQQMAFQKQQAYNAQVQANRQQALSYQQAQQQAYRDRQAQITDYTGKVRADHAARNAYHKQIQNNADSANRGYVAEQQKVLEAQKAAAFKSQAIYAKSIGAMGSVLASGMTGKSVGLMALDAERQGGFAIAEQTASVESAQDAAAVAMEGIYLQQKSANNQAHNNLPFSPRHPVLVPDPQSQGYGENLGLGIPSYNWGF